MRPIDDADEPSGAASEYPMAGEGAAADGARPPGLMPIGLFSRLTDLSQKALRLYDRKGLLRPQWTDPGSGYRYYHAAQLADAEIVRLLRSLDVPVAAIPAIIGGAHDPEPLAEALRVQRARIDRLLEGHPLPMTLDRATLVDAPELVGLSRYAACAHDELDAVEWRLLDELDVDLRRLGLTAAGREWVVYHDDSGLWPAHHVELFQPVEPPADPAVHAGLARLGGGSLVRTVYEGGYDGIRLAYAELLRWALDRGLLVGGDPRERYLVDERDTDDPNAYRTEIAWPVQPPKD